MRPEFTKPSPYTKRPAAIYPGFIKRPESDNPKSYVYISKDYIDKKTGQPVPYFPRFDVGADLPEQVSPTQHYMAQVGLKSIPTAIPDKFGFLPWGIVNKVLECGAKLRFMSIPKDSRNPDEPNCITLQDWMPANKSRLRLDKNSDEYFVDRRLNGFNPGKLNRAKGKTTDETGQEVEKPWQYEVRYETKEHETAKPGAILPEYCEARFNYSDRKLSPHSIKYHIKPGGPVTVNPSDGQVWADAKYIFRNCEYIFQEIQSHLGRTHMNMDQYAVAFYRNIVHNPIWQLLSPHFEGLLSIDKLGASLIIGETGFIPEASSLDNDNVTKVLVDEIKELDYHWHPKEQWVEDDVENDYFKRASKAMWELLEDYVNEFFEEHKSAIGEPSKSGEHYWSEVEGMSKDLYDHSIAAHPERMKITSVEDLKLLCVYVIYHCTFLHSWVNNKQYEDGGDIEYASIGLWDETAPQYNAQDVYNRHNKQIELMWTLASIHYNPIIEYGPDPLKKRIWDNRDRLEPGIPIGWLMMSINI